MDKEIELKRFCGQCGSPLTATWEDTWFNQLTGEEEGSIRWTCPNREFLNWRGHSEYISDMNGSTYRYEY